MRDDLDDLPDADLRLRALPLMGVERLSDDERQSWRHVHGGDVEWLHSVGGERPFSRMLTDEQAPDPATGVGDAMALVEAARAAHWHPNARLEIYPPDAEGYYVALAWDGYDGRETEAEADAKTLPRALTVLALRLAAMRGAGA